jgi:triosephosphate isomerase
MSHTANERRPILAGNWKMNLLRREADEFCSRLVPAVTAARAEVVIFPPATLLVTVARALTGSPVVCGGQDVHPEMKGAHTGDISGPQLADAGASWVLCGHSERRADHGEDDRLVAQKAKAAEQHGLLPLICLGESAAERQEERTFEVLERRLTSALALGPKRFEIAYEPIWAIGSGQTATPEIAQTAHAFLRKVLSGLVGEALGQSVRILYGGSANPGNVADLFAQPDIDGFLVGGASLDVEKFLDMIRCCG